MYRLTMEHRTQHCVRIVCRNCADPGAQRGMQMMSGWGVCTYCDTLTSGVQGTQCSWLSLSSNSLLCSCGLTQCQG